LADQLAPNGYLFAAFGGIVRASALRVRGHASAPNRGIASQKRSNKSLSSFSGREQG
jgi:hypothetical protein